MLPVVIRRSLALVRALALTSLAFAAGCAGSAGAGADRGGPLGPGDHALEIAVGARTRHLIVHVPPGTIERARPLVLAFHGGGGSAAGYQRTSGIDRVADREGFVAAYPSGTGRNDRSRRFLTWNAGACCGRAQAEGANDVAFALAAIEAVAARVAVDPGRVYAIGHSNGSMMAHRVGVEAGARFAAIAGIAGATELAPFAPSAALPVLHIHSEDDPRAPFEGGVRESYRWPIRHLPVDVQLARWRRHNACPEAAAVGARREAQGQTAVLERWGPCRGGSEVALLRLTGAGHGWPGGRAQLPARIVGDPPVVIDAMEEAWSFFARFRRDETGTLRAN